MNKNVKLELTQITSKKDGKVYECVKLSVGLYDTLIFPKPLELAYIKQQLAQEGK